ncbi:MAG: hypothetical protein U1D55_13935 [Phycisphaerae bacterium]
MLLSGKNGVATNDLEFREYADMVERLLQSRGFAKAERELDANLVVFLNYGISDPKTQEYTYSVPMYGQIGGGGSTYYSGSVYTSKGGYGTYSGSAYSTPVYGVTGYRSGVGSYTYFVRYVRMDGVNLEKYRQSGTFEPVWKATVTSVGSSGDLREVFPYMLVASADHIGTRTEKALSITLKENDERLAMVRPPVSDQSNSTPK